MKKIVIGLLVLAALAGGVFYWLMPRMAPPGEALQFEASNPTDFVHEGELSWTGSPAASSTLHLVYNIGAPEAVPLVFDALSSCAAQNGAVPCIALSVTFEAFNGQHAVVEGELTEGAVLVRKMLFLEEGEEPRLPSTGDVFIAWPQAVAMLGACEVSMATQTHALDVHLTLKDGRRVRAVEPAIDEIVKTLELVQESCGAIPVATE